MGSMVWAWCILALGVQWFVIFLFPEREGMGRILSRPLHRFVFFRPPLTRFSQWACLGVVMLVLEIGVDVSDKIGQASFYIPFISLYLDDYLTGDDDKWRRFWEGVRNKIKWKMKLPQPETGSRTA